MFILALVLLSLIVALLRGGRLSRLAATPFQRTYLVVFSLALQIAIFSSLPNTLGIAEWVPEAYVFSLIVLAVWFGLNYHVPGMAVVGIGLLLNLGAIAANGGHMPASSAALEISGMIDNFAAPQQTVYNNIIIATEDTRLYYLTDIFALPKAIPLSNTFSIGDVLIAGGAMYFLQCVLTDEALDPAALSAS